MSNKMIPILIVGFIGFAGYKIYTKKFAAPEKNNIAEKTEIKIDLSNVPRVTLDDMILGKTCQSEVIKCEDLGLQEKLSEGIIFKDHILYIIKNVNNPMHEIKQAYTDLDLIAKAEAIAYSTMVHPLLLGKLKFESTIHAIRVFSIEVEYAIPKFIKGFEITKDKAEAINIQVSKVLPDEIFINGNLKLAQEFFKDKATEVNK